MKRISLRKCTVILLVAFVALFGFRLLHGYISYPASGGGTETVAGNQRSSFEYSGRNYASKSAKPMAMKGGGGSRAPLSVDQKYEKVGTVALKSKIYDEDEKAIRSAIIGVDGLIQFEQNSGLVGQRSLHLAIGVLPERFDELIAKLQTLGTLTSIRIDKVDKTNEYKKLQAQRTSLEATKESLVGLKAIGTGSIEELIRLEEKISETEAQIQDLGVNLGDYDSENEFCTVKCSLLEVTFHAGPNIGLMQRVKVALEWTVEIFLKLLSIGVLGSLSLWGAFLALSFLQKSIPIIQKLMTPKVSGEA